MSARDDLQHYLPEELRHTLTVIPKQSLRHGMLSASLMALGFGLSLAALTEASVLVWAFPVTVILARMRGNWIRKYEEAHLNRATPEG